MIVLVGPAGAGKSMQGHRLADEYGFAYISTGEIFRVLITGRRRNEMLEGHLLSDTEVIRVVDKVLELIDTKEQFILDGFPRTKTQIDWLLGQVEQSRFELPMVINLDIDEAAVRDRLNKRGRMDDTEEAISRRYAEYQEVTRPILDYMKARGLRVCDIDASGAPAEVHEKIAACLGLKP